jgi:hypothetical protein
MVLQASGKITASDLAAEFGVAIRPVLLSSFASGGSAGVTSAGAPNVPKIASGVRVGTFYGAFKLLAPVIANIPATLTSDTSAAAYTYTAHLAADSLYTGTPIFWSFLEAAPAGVSIDSSSGEITVTRYTSVSSQRITIVATGPSGLQGQRAVTLAMDGNLAPPTWLTIPTLSFTSGNQTVNLATYSSGANLTYSLIFSPAYVGCRVDGSILTIQTDSRNVSYSIVVSATNSKGTVNTTISITEASTSDSGLVPDSPATGISFSTTRGAWTTSSSYDYDAATPSWKAFDDRTVAWNSGWSCALRYTPNTGAYTGTTTTTVDGSVVSGEWLQINSPRGVMPTRIVLTTGSDWEDRFRSRMPSSFVFAGLDGNVWRTILAQTNVTYTAVSKTFDFTPVPYWFTALRLIVRVAGNPGVTSNRHGADLAEMDITAFYHP